MLLHCHLNIYNKLANPEGTNIPPLTHLNIYRRNNTELQTWHGFSSLQRRHGKSKSPVICVTVPLKSEAKIDPKHPKKPCLQGLLRTSLNLCNGFMQKSDMITPYDLSCRTWKVFLRASEKLHPLLHLTTSPIHQESSPAESILESPPPWSLYNPLISPYLLGGVALRVGGVGIVTTSDMLMTAMMGSSFFFRKFLQLAAKIWPMLMKRRIQVFDELWWLFPLRL